MLSLRALALISLVSARQIIGVSPEKQVLYTPDEHGKWHCLSNPSIEISFNQINDDFCDCPDGSDEPGTNACDFTKISPKYFYCANAGFKEAYIENYKLNDGVCDYETCCDGSDEYKSGACPNVCDQVKHQYDEFLISKKEALKKALEVKKELQEKAHSMKHQLVVSAADLRKEIEQEEKELDDLQQQLNEESLDLTEFSFIDTFVHDYSHRLEQKFSQWSEHFEKADERVKLLENILNHLLENYNPNFNDQAVKQAVTSFADYISNKPETESKPTFEMAQFSLEELSETYKDITGPQNVVSAPEPSFLESLIRQAQSLFAKDVVVNPPSPSPPPSSPAPTNHAKTKLSSKSIEKIKSKISDTEKSLTQKKSEESIYKDSIDENYGDTGIYRAVKNKWVNKIIGEYNYKLGYLDSLYQDNTLIGRFVNIQGTSMIFSHGSKCWNGPRRSAIVDMVCGVEHDLISVSEPEKCQYRFVMSSPLVCEESTEDEIARGFEVDRAMLTI